MNKNIHLYSILEKLFSEHTLSFAEYCTLIDCRNSILPIDKNFLDKFQINLSGASSSNEISVSALCKLYAKKIVLSVYGNKVFIRGLVEFSNYCKNNCYYCGIRAENSNTERYRLSKKQIIECFDKGYEIGFRTLVIQGGEDLFFSDEMIADIVRSIKNLHPDCAVTLSLGEKEFETYKLWKEAGADRYLLRHETASDEHYRKLHPCSLSPEHRKQCLWNLKSLGFQTGAGFMVGSPYQTTQNLVQDLFFLQDLKPEMIGIGPFIHHSQTPFKNMKDGSCEETLFLLSVLRIMFPNVLLPATTALGTIESDGREQGILCGANVIMPNLSPVLHRKDYLLYDNKITTGEEAAENLRLLKESMNKIGYEIVVSRGDFKD